MRKVHYSLYGEWGGSKTPCGLYTSDVSLSCNESKVTCKRCLKSLNKKAK